MLISTIVLSILIIFALLRWLQKKFIKTKSELKRLQQEFNDLKSILSDDSKYLRYSVFKIQKKNLTFLKDQTFRIKSLILKRKINDLRKEITAFEEALSEFREQTNQRFFQIEKEKAHVIFKDEKGNDLLTDEQVKAVLSDDERNLIIAGAGSGKTRVIDFKVRYLVHHKKISPQKILLLSFSKKSANDLVRKISENIPGIEARTIHSFSSQIIGRQDKKIFEEAGKELDSIAIKALAETLKQKNHFRQFKKFYDKYFSDLKPMIFYQTIDELRKDLKKLNSKLSAIQDPFDEIQAQRMLKTLKGDLVRSIDERYIADFLYLHDIKYEYERPYPDSPTRYNPDFYLPDFDAYIEHFAITASGKPPAYFSNPEKYLEGIQWKRNLHREKGTKLIESYSYLLNSIDTSNYLTEIFNKSSIEVKNALNEDIYQKISKEFYKMLVKFYRAYKLSGKTVEDLKKAYPQEVYSLFLEIFKDFLIRFESIADKENKMDFNDLILGAIDQYKASNGRKYDYVIVDEFQDTSNLAMKLLDQICHSNPETTLLCVGDDWQSIYGFNGSDVSIFSHFSRKYEDVSSRFLNSNFRSHSRIVDLGKQFISKNPAQISKNVFSKNKSIQESNIDFLTIQQMEQKIRELPDEDSVFVIYRYNADCPVNYGAFEDDFTLDKYGRPTRKKECKKNISMMTIHASKGLEAKHVFVVFPEGTRRKFPSEIEDHFIFNILKTDSDDYPFAEERRLMYVAITRAEQNLYFVSYSNDPNSIFWDELKELTQHERPKPTPLAINPLG